MRDPGQFFEYSDDNWHIWGYNGSELERIRSVEELQSALLIGCNWLKSQIRAFSTVKIFEETPSNYFFLAFSWKESREFEILIYVTFQIYLEKTSKKDEHAAVIEWDTPDKSPWLDH